MKKYNIIYADPPWNFRAWDANKKKHPNARVTPYKTMKDTDIYNLLVNQIAADNCALFLWATYAKLPEAIKTIDIWGFEYKTVAFTWVKKTKRDKWHFGLGHWTRANPEICLLGVKGKLKRVAKNITNLTIDVVREHSRKPDAVRDKIVELMGDLPRIELFARQKIEGWDVWGNEVENDVELDSMPIVDVDVWSKK